MISHSTIKPAVFEKVGNGELLYHYDITEETQGEEKQVIYQYEEVRFLVSDDKGKLFKKAIADKYSLEQELKMLNESIGLDGKVKNTEERKAFLTERLRIQNQVDNDWAKFYGESWKH